MRRVDWGQTGPLLALLLVCAGRVAWGLARREPFGPEPSLALLLAAASAWLIRLDFAPVRR